MSKWPDDFIKSGEAALATSSLGVAVRPMFFERNVTFDGRVRTVTPAVIDDTTFTYDLSPFRMSTSSSVDGAVTHVPSGSLAKLFVEDTGSFAGIRSNKRTHYAVGQIVDWTSVVRLEGSSSLCQWGLFDDKQGFFFERSGSDLNVVKRSSVTGERVETRLSQSVWNVDRFDGTGESGMSLDPTSNNIYSIFYQCHGVGRVAFHVNDIRTHVIDSRGEQIGGVIGSGDIVSCFEVRGPGSGSLLTGGVSTRIEADRPEFSWHGRPFTATTPLAVSLPTSQTHLISIRPKLSSSSGVSNDSLVYPTDIEVMALDPILISVYMGTMPPSGSNRDWKDISPNSLVEKLTTGSFTPAGQRLFARALGGSEETIHLHDDFQKIFNNAREALTVRPYGGGQEVLTLTSRKATGGGTTSVTAILRWDEVI